MSTKRNATQILNELKKHYQYASDNEFAKFLGIAATTLSSWKSRNNIDYDLVYSKCVGVNANWLLTGQGPMFKEDAKSGQTDPDQPVAKRATAKGEGIPLIPADAMAGVCQGELSVLDFECERYVVPAFKGADFLITVKGSSMYPKYNSGDIVACKKLPLNDLFFQWNKVYVIDTIQGALIKRVKKANNDDHIILASDNPSYEPFELHKSQINAVAIVMGVIRLE